MEAGEGKVPEWKYLFKLPPENENGYNMGI